MYRTRSESVCQLIKARVAIVLRTKTVNLGSGYMHRHLRGFETSILSAQMLEQPSIPGLPFGHPLCSSLLHYKLRLGP